MQDLDAPMTLRMFHEQMALMSERYAETVRGAMKTLSSRVPQPKK